MDITVHVSGVKDGEATVASVQWQDADSNRYHIFIHRQPDGSWIIDRPTYYLAKLQAGTVYKNPSRSIARHTPGYFDTRHLDAGSKAWAATVRYVLEQVNAHHLVEEETKAVIFRQEQKTREVNEAHAEMIRQALYAFAEVPGLTCRQEVSSRHLAESLDTAQANHLSRLIHGLD